MTMIVRNVLPCLVLLALSISPMSALAQEAGGKESDAEIVKKLQNPVANIISVPFQSNFDFGGGPRDDGFRYTLNIQPVIPFELNDKWNLITRTIIPLVNQDEVVDLGSQSGLGDITQTFFFSPAAPGGLIWGVGPVLLYPTATDNRLGFEKWGIGPSALVLKQSNGWSLWTLANHVSSFAGDSARDGVSLTFINPGVSYQTKTLTTFLVQTESTYDWRNEQWTVPINVGVSQLIRIGRLPISIGLQGRYYAEKPTNGPDWGIRFVVTPVFAK